MLMYSLGILKSHDGLGGLIILLQDEEQNSYVLSVHLQEFKILVQESGKNVNGSLGKQDNTFTQRFFFTLNNQQ